MFSSSFRKLGLAFNLEYLCQFFINFNNQCQFWNPHDEQITNLSLIFKFNEEIMEKIGNEEDETKLILESWKACFYQHRSSFTHRTGKQTSLSNHIWKLRDQDLDYRLTWGVLGHARPYNPVTGLCRLCLLEKYFILYGQKATLNKRTEIYGWCHHKSKYFLSNFM